MNLFPVDGHLDGQQCFDISSAIENSLVHNVILHVYIYLQGKSLEMELLGQRIWAFVILVVLTTFLSIEVRNRTIFLHLWMRAFVSLWSPMARESLDRCQGYLFLGGEVHSFHYVFWKRSVTQNRVKNHCLAVSCLKLEHIALYGISLL